MYPRSSQENNRYLSIFIRLPVVHIAGAFVSWHSVVMTS